MDENFIMDLVADGEKKLGLDIPLSMTFVDALNGLKGTVSEVIEASEGWKDQGGLKNMIALEAEGWKGIFQKASQVASGDDMSLVNTLADGDNADKLLELAKSGNKVMKHFFIMGEVAADSLKIYFVFQSAPRPQFTTSIDFG